MVKRVKNVYRELGSWVVVVFVFCFVFDNGLGFFFGGVLLLAVTFLQKFSVN